MYLYLPTSTYTCIFRDNESLSDLLRSVACQQDQGRRKLENFIANLIEKQSTSQPIRALPSSQAGQPSTSDYHGYYHDDASANRTRPQQKVTSRSSSAGSRRLVAKGTASNRTFDRDSGFAESPLSSMRRRKKVRPFHIMIVAFPLSRHHSSSSLIPSSSSSSSATYFRL